MKQIWENIFEKGYGVRRGWGLKPKSPLWEYGSGLDLFSGTTCCRGWGAVGRNWTWRILPSIREIFEKAHTFIFILVFSFYYFYSLYIYVGQRIIKS